jgi:DeoR family transcriptional regulator of aga operon
VFTSMKVCSISELHTIVTDDSVDPKLVEAFQKKQVRVVIV